MSIKFKLFTAATSVAFVFAMAGLASAQETAPKGDTPQAERKGPGKGGFMKHGRGMRGGKRGGKRGMGPGGIMQELRGLNLTQAQRDQIRGIMESNKPSEAVREEMKTINQARRNGTITDAQKARVQELMVQGRTKMEQVRTQALAVLTVEQKQKLDERKAKMEQRREQMKQRREECKQNPEACKGPGPRPRGQRGI